MRGHGGHLCSAGVLFGDDESVLVEHVLGEAVVSAANLLWGVRDERGQIDRDPDDYRGQRSRAAHQLPGRRGRRAANTATVISTSLNAAARAVCNPSRSSPRLWKRCDRPAVEAVQGAAEKSVLHTVSRMVEPKNTPSSAMK